ncbi:hypothetical protein Tco_0549388 [Tanacetum coccineum]
MTPGIIKAMINQLLLRKLPPMELEATVRTEDNPTDVQTARPCFYTDFMKCQPLNFKGTEASWSVLSAYYNDWDSRKVLKKKDDEQVLSGVNQDFEIELWTKGSRGTKSSITELFQELTYDLYKFVANENRRRYKYISGLPDNFYGTSSLPDPKTLDEILS